MTFLVKHTKTKYGSDELMFKNGRHTIHFSLSDDMGKNGIAFDIYKGKDISNGREVELLAGFNLLGQRMSGPYNFLPLTKKAGKLALSNFELEGRAKRYAEVEGDVPGVPNHPIFTVDKEPFDRITFCDSEGDKAIDMKLDKEGRITSISVCSDATTRDDLIVMFEDENNPKLSKLVDLNKTSYRLDDNRTAALKTKIAGMSSKPTTQKVSTR